MSEERREETLRQAGRKGGRQVTQFVFQKREMRSDAAVSQLF